MCDMGAKKYFRPWDGSDMASKEAKKPMDSPTIVHSPMDHTVTPTSDNAIDSEAATISSELADRQMVMACDIAIDRQTNMYNPMLLDRRLTAKDAVGSEASGINYEPLTRHVSVDSGVGSDGDASMLRDEQLNREHIDEATANYFSPVVLGGCPASIHPEVTWASDEPTDSEVRMCASNQSPVVHEEHANHAQFSPSSSSSETESHRVDRLESHWSDSTLQRRVSVGSASLDDFSQGPATTEILSNFVHSIGAPVEVASATASTYDGSLSAASSFSDSPNSAFVPPVLPARNSPENNFIQPDEVFSPQPESVADAARITAAMAAAYHATYLYSVPQQFYLGRPEYPFGPYVESIEAAANFIAQEEAAAKREKKSRPKKHQCTYCNVAFSNNGQLKGHIRIHTGERPFKCKAPNCGKTFTRNEELTRHGRIHSGVKPHKCPECFKHFGRKDHLKKHMRTHINRAYYQIQPSVLGPNMFGSHAPPLMSHRIDPFAIYALS